MKLNPKAEIYLPNLAKKGKKKYLCISAHHDDTEFMAFHGILKAFYDRDAAFYAAITTDGAGCVRTGPYKDYTDEDMIKVRAVEQKKAAEVGSYGGLYLLNYTSKEAKDPSNDSIANDFTEILEELKPDVVYMHNPLDKHPTHLGVCAKTMRALCALSEKNRPEKVYGCEVWRGLDFAPEDLKVTLDVSGGESLAAAVMGVFDSQIAGGKRYDLATAGRRRSNATYGESHEADAATETNYALDLTPVMEGKITLTEYAEMVLNGFKAGALIALRRVTEVKK